MPTNLAARNQYRAGHALRKRVDTWKKDHKHRMRTTTALEKIQLSRRKKKGSFEQKEGDFFLNLDV